ncbi:MAG: hypothetical protein AABZ77_08515, partial [Chloroflexota bacterium]
MPRRKTKNLTGISRLQNIPYHDAWVSFVCLNCKENNTIQVGQDLLSPLDAYETQQWKCGHCGFIHSKETDLPFSNWPKDSVLAESSV